MPVPEELGYTQEELEGYREQFAQGKACPHCGGLHLRACPRVRRLVFRGTDDNERIAEVEFWREGLWPKDNIVWPEDVYEETEEEAPQDGQETTQAVETIEANEAGEV